MQWFFSVTHYSPGADTSLFMFSSAKFLLVFLGVDHIGT